MSEGVTEEFLVGRMVSRCKWMGSLHVSLYFAFVLLSTDGRKWSLVGRLGELGCRCW